MEIVHSIYDFIPTHQTYVTIGTFDGVHIGHQKIVKKLIEQGKKDGKKSVLLTFFPHPRMVLQKDTSIKLINTIEERSEQLKNLGLDYLIIHPFDVEFSKLTALKFVRDILVNQLNISKLIIGYDHHFGKNREGNITELTEYSYLYDFEVEEIPAQDINAVDVSSTKIRTALLSGDIETANAFLGYNFSISGTVVKGKQLGNKIGYPTANIEVQQSYKLIPKPGVYVVQSSFEGVMLLGMMNIGNRPTVSGTHQTIEVHFFDFKADLYNQDLTIAFLCFLREEQKFNSLEKLTKQLQEDELASRNILFNQSNK